MLYVIVFIAGGFTSVVALFAFVWWASLSELKREDERTCTWDALEEERHGESQTSDHH